MKNKWSEKKAAEFLSRYGAQWGEDLALRTYSSRLLGAQESLVLHGGGNTSVKSFYTNIVGDRLPAVFVKGSGYDLERIEPEGHAGVELEYLKRLRGLKELSDRDMVGEIRSHLFDFRSPTPSIETLVHAFLPRKFIDHTHADAILALTNQPDGEKIVEEALGDEVLVLGYVKPGFQLAKASAEALGGNPKKKAMVWMRHGLVTWGDTARESYEAMDELVAKAEEYRARKVSRPLKVRVSTSLETARERWIRVAPLLRGLLAEPSKQEDRPYKSVIVRPLIRPEVLDFVDSDRGRELALTPPLTSDHLIRTKALPLWVDSPHYPDVSKLRDQLSRATREYRAAYETYVDRHSSNMPPGMTPFDSAPRVILMPGMGAACSGRDVLAANVCRDITAHTLEVKAHVGAMGSYQSLEESDLFAMEYYSLQHAKLQQRELPLGRQVAVVTGAAGAIGSGISRVLLEQGCHVAVTDLPGERLDSLVKELKLRFGEHVLGVALNVTDPDSVAGGFAEIISEWGGVDLVVINAGVALVSSLGEMDLEAFRRLERINVEGALLMLSEAARHFRTQATGGDVVVVSSKNVFAPGAGFGAYSATKAAAHQLARIASLEMAEIGVRVNMVAPDAVFSEGERKSGLWEEVGPDRMRARGLDEKGLQEYYRERNLLKTEVTATHVANAVLFFLTRQTPTTGATLPVDGGLPDATPR